MDANAMDFDVFLELDEDGLWVAEVPSLPGVYTQGASREQAMERIKEAIILYIESEGIPRSRAIGVERVHVEA
jgi:predicted RNase H-like HicB family nuclease